VPGELLAGKDFSNESYAAAERPWGSRAWRRWSRRSAVFRFICLTAATFQINPPANDPTPFAEKIVARVRPVLR
jgi:hypothetical protein